MKTIIQRVNFAKVTIENEIVGEICEGLLILVGFENSDTEEDIEWMVKKIVGLRIFNDKEGKMNLSILDIDGEVLIVSQFTLHANTKKGNRPSFIKAAKPEISIPLYNQFVKKFKDTNIRKIATGIFGAYMKINFENDGPVTIIIDSKNNE